MQQKALEAAKCIGGFLAAASLGILPFWQWAIQGYATGWTILISAVVAAGLAVYAIMQYLPTLENANLRSSMSMGALLSIMVGMGFLIASTTVYENDVMLVDLADGSKGVYSLKQNRYYSPFVEVHVLPETQGYNFWGGNLMCQTEFCDIRVRISYEVEQDYIIQTIANGTAEEMQYSSIVYNAMMETIVADRPYNRWDLEDAIEARINERLGLEADAETPIKIDVRELNFSIEVDPFANRDND